MAVLHWYIQAADIDLSTQFPLFRPLTKKKLEYTLKNAKLSYNRCRDIFKNAVGSQRLWFPYFTLWWVNHCCYSNELSHNVSERLLKLHGRWKSDEAKDMYVNQNVIHK